MNKAPVLLFLLFAACSERDVAPLPDYSALLDEDCTKEGDVCELSGYCRQIEGAPLLCQERANQVDTSLIGFEVSEEQFDACKGKSKSDSCSWEGICRRLGDLKEFACSF